MADQLSKDEIDKEVAKERAELDALSNDKLLSKFIFTYQRKPRGLGDRELVLEEFCDRIRARLESQ